MRKVNFRFVFTGLVLAVLALGFFLLMASIAHKSNNPVEMLRVAGQASGVAGAIGLVLVVLGLLGKGFKKAG
jgi:hypothetical protein